MRDKFVQYFGDKIPQASGGKVCCLWHDDKDASLVLSYDEGKCFCFGCGASHKIDDLLQGYDKEIGLDTVKKFHDVLMDSSNSPAREWTEKVKGWTAKVLKDYLIGFNGTRFTIPVWSDRIGGRCVNMRLYHASGTPKIVSFGEGYGKNVWFPYPPDVDEIYLMEGESDTLLARSMGLPAFTQTGGAGYWCDQFTKDLSNKKVSIVYDQDRAGQSGASHVVTAIKFTCEVRNLRIPVSGTNKDFSDWILKDGGDLTQLSELKIATAPYAISKMQVSVDNPTPLPLYETANARWAYKAVTCDVVVAGKDRSPYMVPYKYTLDCRVDKKAICTACPNRAGKVLYTIDWRDGKLTRFVDLAENHRDAVLREMAGVVGICKSQQITVNEFQNVEKLALFPRKDVLAVDVDMPAEVNMLRKAYFLGIGIQANAMYRCCGIPIPDTRDQSSVLLIVEAEPLDTVEEITDLSLCECFRLEESNAQGQAAPGVL